MSFFSDGVLEKWRDIGWDVGQHGWIHESQVEEGNTNFEGELKIFGRLRIVVSFIALICTVLIS